MPARSARPAAKVRATTRPKPVLLTGGNPQIAKADGEAPVTAYIAALPGWKRRVAERLDALIVNTVPGVRKAVKWNSPMYGLEGQGFFVSFHTFTHYVKLTFFKGTSLRPPPSGGTAKDARWIDIREDDFDETRLRDWIRQAAAIPGWSPGASTPMTKTTSKGKDLVDWRVGTLARMRELILAADPAITETRKWKKPTNPAGVPVFERAGIVCTGETYAKAVKLTFAHGASLPDPKRLFNASLEGGTRRAIDIREGETVNAAAFKALVKAAVKRNLAAANE